MNVADFLLSDKPPDWVALQTLEREYTYGEVRCAAAAVASFLLHHCGEKGERVIIAGENSFFWVAAYLGTLQAGYVSVPVPASLAPEFFDYLIEVTEARVVFADAPVVQRLHGHLKQCHIVTDRAAKVALGATSQQAFSDLEFDDSESPKDYPELKTDELAALMFTSGSTGTPRAVMISHANILANTSSIIQYLELTAQDRIMDVLPFHYCFGTSLLHTHLRVGGSLVIEPHFVYPEIVLERMIDTKCTGFAGVPSHFHILLRRSGLREKRFPYLRYVQQAGGSLAPNYIRELRQALPDTRIFIMYGQTEATARLSYLPPELLETKLGSIGKGIPGVTLSVIGEGGQAINPGETGEIVATGDNVAKGYWRAPLESAAIFRNGTLYTGDLATVDQDGYIYITGRSKDFLKRGGIRVSCRQLEDRILGCEGVLDAAVIGIPDEVLGDAVKLFVVPRDPSCAGFEEHVRSFCRKHLGPQLVAKEIVVLSALPKNSAGKVDKERLRQNSLMKRRKTAGGECQEPEHE